MFNQSINQSVVITAKEFVFFIRTVYWFQSWITFPLRSALQNRTF